MALFVAFATSASAYTGNPHFLRTNYQQFGVIWTKFINTASPYNELTTIEYNQGFWFEVGVENGLSTSQHLLLKVNPSLDGLGWYMNFNEDDPNNALTNLSCWRATSGGTYLGYFCSFDLAAGGNALIQSHGAYLYSQGCSTACQKGQQAYLYDYTGNTVGTLYEGTTKYVYLHN